MPFSNRAKQQRGYFSLNLTNSFTCETYNKKSCLYRQKKQAERIFCLLCYNDLKVVK